MGVSLAEVDLIATIHVLVRMHEYLTGLTVQCSGGIGSIYFLIITLSVASFNTTRCENKIKTKGDSDGLRIIGHRGHTGPRSVQLQSVYET